MNSNGFISAADGVDRGVSSGEGTASPGTSTVVGSGEASGCHLEPATVLRSTTGRPTPFAN